MLLTITFEIPTGATFVATFVFSPFGKILFFVNCPYLLFFLQLLTIPLVPPQTAPFESGWYTPAHQKLRVFQKSSAKNPLVTPKRNLQSTGATFNNEEQSDESNYASHLQVKLIDYNVCKG
jgi:hypothetical protein